MIGVKLNMPRHKTKASAGTSSRRRGAQPTQAELKRFRRASYRRGDIVIGFPDQKHKMLVLDIVDKKNYYQYKLLVLNTGEYTSATAWYMEECLTQYGNGTLPPPLA